jgi:hypothetical protein
MMFDSYPTCRKGIVNLKGGTALRGVIWKRRGGYLILRNAELLRARETPVAMDGEVLVYERDVEFIQLVGSVG